MNRKSAALTAALVAGSFAAGRATVAQPAGPETSWSSTRIWRGPVQPDGGVRLETETCLKTAFIDGGSSIACHPGNLVDDALLNRLSKL